jgi:hypothetical protein
MAQPITVPRRSSFSLQSSIQLSSSLEVVRDWSQSYRRATIFSFDRNTPMPKDESRPIDTEDPQLQVSFIDIQPEEQPLLPVLQSSVKTTPKSTIYQSLFNSVNILMGIGLLSLPYALNITGWVVGIALLILFSFMTRHTAILLQKLLDHDTDKLGYSYGDIGEMAFGQKGRIFISFIFFLELFAVNVY